MNKTELINAIAAESGLTKTDSKKALDAFISCVSKGLKEGEKISLLGFGTFAINERSARTGINPATKAVINIPARKVVKFKAGTELAANIE